LKRGIEVVDELVDVVQIGTAVACLADVVGVGLGSDSERCGKKGVY
jgi:hypothetical protein